MSRVLAAATALVAAAAVGVALPAAAARYDVSAGRTAFVNRPRVVDVNNSPSLVRNPVRGENVVVANRVDRPQFGALVHSSTDGGASWSETRLPLPEGLDRPFAPDIGFASDGTLFATYVNLQGAGNVPDNVWLARSDDGGRTFSTPVRVAGALAFQVRLAVAGGGRVHVTWLQGKAVGPLRFTDGPNPIVMATSTDGGRSFGRPVEVSDSHRPRVGAATPRVDAAGEVVVLYEDFGDDRRDFEFLEGPPWDQPFRLVFTRSSDGGRTFAEGVEVDGGLVAARRFLVFLPEFPSLATGADGSLYVTWSDARHGDDDVFVRRSGDGGRTWSGARTVAGAAGTAQSLPAVAVAPNGRVDVLYLDGGGDDRRPVVWATLASSFDEGRSFTTARMADAPSDPRIGATAAPGTLPVDLGSRLGLHSSDDAALSAWTDTSLGTAATGRQDIALAAATFPRRAPSTVRLLASAALLALAAGLLACSILVARRRAGRLARP